MSQVWIIFDVDGTLYDCSNIIAEAFQKGIEEYISGSSLKIKLPSASNIVGQIGQPIHLFFQHLFPGVSLDVVKEIQSVCMEKLNEFVRKERGSLYPEVINTLELLKNKGYNFFVASNGALDYIYSVLETYGLDKYFELPFLSIETARIKNKSDIVAHYKMKAMVGDVFIMVGDRYSDLEAARNNDISFIGCSFGHTGDSELSGSDIIVNDFDEIPVAIKFLLDQKS